MAGREWKSASVRMMAGGDDPARTVSDKARRMVLDALDKGWTGPPYDPALLAALLGIRVEPNEAILDARLVPEDGGGAVIEYNPNRPEARIRFSIAHEVAHTLFPDHRDTIRNRSAGPVSSDEREVELLCNMAAAELLMPALPEEGLEKVPFTMAAMTHIRRTYAVSIEAALLRMADLTAAPATVFVASRTNGGGLRGSHRVDYAKASRGSPLLVDRGSDLSRVGALGECSAVGYTRAWCGRLNGGRNTLDLECIGIAPYRGTAYPRVMGIAKARLPGAPPPPPSISAAIGDAASPGGAGMRIIAHIANDRGPRWGRGFGYALTRKFPGLRTAFAEWAAKGLELGTSHTFDAGDNLGVFSMVAQHGYLPSRGRPPIRYAALSKCLEQLGAECRRRAASVHMPRIGTGHAGGRWEMASELINRHLVSKDVPVTVYTPPGMDGPAARSQTVLDQYGEGAEGR